MIQFNELNISPDCNKLIIDISVKSLDYYQNVYIDAIIIDTQDTFITGGPSKEPIYTKTIEGNTKSLRLELSTDVLLPSLKDNMFFIWVRTKGTPAINTPCGEDNTLTLGVAIALYPLYQYSFNFIKELEKECSIPKGFINYILQLKALQVAIKTGHYIQAIKYWEKFFKNLKINTTTDLCNCYG